jgi:hypothetical protein
VTDVAGVPRRAVEEPPVEHDAAPDAGGHHHGDEIALASRSPDPSFAERQRFRIVVDVHVEAGVLRELGPQRERTPRRDVQRRDELASRRHRAPATHPDDLSARTRGARQRVEQIRHRRPQRVGVRCRRRGGLDPSRDRAVLVNETRSDLGAADVDREGGPHGRTT